MRTAIFQTIPTAIDSLRQLAKRACTWRNAGLLAAALVLFVATSGVARAQTGSGPTNYLDAVGQPEYSTPTPVELGYVEQANGHLHIEIPVGQPVPQRGNPKGFQFRITYDSNMWTPTLDIADVPVWASTGTGNLGGTWNLLPGFNSARTDYITGSQLQVIGARYIDANLTSHWIEQNSSGSAYASDSTGYLFMPNVNTPTGGGQVLYGPDGSVLFANLAGMTGTAGFVTDPNGNYLDVFHCVAPPPPTGFSSVGNYLCDPSGRPIQTTYFTGVAGDGSMQAVVMVPNSQGGSSSYLIQFVNISVQTAFGQPHFVECTYTSCPQVTVIKSITLPDNTSYTFKYDCDPSIAAQSTVCNSLPGMPSYYGYYGELTQMNLPTGGEIDYSWQVFNDAYQQRGVWLASRRVGGGVWMYHPFVISYCTSGTQVGCQQAYSETDPEGFTTTSSFTMDNAGQPFPTSVQTPLTTTTTTWDFTHSCTIALPGSGCAGHAYIVKLAETESILGAGGATLTKKTAYTYDTVPGQTYTVTGLITGVKEWGYYPGASPTFPTVPDRATYTSYYSPANSPYQYWGGGTNIHRPQIVTVCNNSGSDPTNCPGGGSRASQTITTYDSPGPSALSGVMNHDDTRYPAALTVRGLPTEVQKWVSGGIYLASYFQYDATGQLLVSIDPNGNHTSFDYTDNYFNDNNTSSPAMVSVSAPTNTYPKTITFPTANGVTFVETFGYYYSSGKKAYSTDFNLQTTHFHFMEPFDRLTSTIFPIGWNLINYTSQNQADVYVPVADPTPSTGCTNCRHEQIKYDALGRKTSEQLVNAPNCPSEVDTTYDVMGRVATKSHPYCYGGAVFETYAYDSLGRVKKVTHPDGQSQTTAYGSDIFGAPGQQGSGATYGYGYPTLATDEVGNQKQTWTDGLGRLIEVDEPSGTGTTSSAGSGSVTINGTEQYATIQTGPNCLLWDDTGFCEEWDNRSGDPEYSTFYDSGWVTITVGGQQYMAVYGQSDTSNSVAAGLAAAMNADPNSPVSASVSGGTVNLTARTAGDTTDYSLSSASASTDNSGNFFGPSFSGSPSGPSLYGGISPGSIGGSPNPTFYTYDVANNLLGVLQGVQTRTFAYDGLDRLMNATNPESGTVSYTYDGDGNVQTKTDARGIVITYQYDSHNRMLSKSYSDSTPSAFFYYDQNNIWGNPISNGVGRLTLTQTASNVTAGLISYDPMGRVNKNWQCVPTVCGFELDYTYNVAGGQTSFSNGLGVTLSYGKDNVGRTDVLSSSVVDANHPATLATVLSFTAWDAISEMMYGNGVVETSAFNNRMQPTQLRTYLPGHGGACCGPIGGGGDDAPPPPPPTQDVDVLNLNYGYVNSAGANNGNVTSLTSTATQIFMRSYTYDSLDRLTTMSSPADASGCYGLSWTYDRYANRLSQSTSGGSGSACGQPSHGVLPNNRLTDIGFSYDASGNMTSDNVHSYSYDAESRLTQVDGGSTATYVYNAEGQRAAKTTSSGTTEYLYDLEGNVSGEWTASPGYTGPSNHYVYLNGQLVAQYPMDAHTYFVHKDHLGDTRVMTKLDGSIYDSMDYLPFGEQIAGGSGTTHKFTGKERDAESGLDDFPARYLGSSLGRWMSPDPLPWLRWQHPPADSTEEEDEEARGKFENWISNPQNFNLYTYVDNNPLRYTDPTGMAGCQSGDKKFTTCTITITYDPKTSKGTLVVTGQNKGDKTPTVLLSSSVVVGGDGHVTPVGTFTASVWEKDHVSTKYGSAANIPFSKTKLGGNAFGPYQLHIRELDSQGIYIHGTMGPSWSPVTWGNSIFLSPTSHGCVRMCNSDDVTLHTMMPNPTGNKIVIKAVKPDGH